MQFARIAIALAAVASLGGCAANEPVVRVLGGELVVGDFVPTEAYQAMLAGALEEAAGHFDAAARSYARVIAFDPHAAEPWARLGLVRCAAGSRADGMAAIEQARSLDSRSASPDEARAVCAEDAGARREALLAAAAREPRDDAPIVALVAAGDDGRVVRARAAAFLLAAPAGAGLFMGLAEMALRAGELDQAAAFASRAVAQSSRVAPSAARLAVDLAARDLSRGRRLSGALADLAPVGASGHGRVATTLGEPLVLRLAVDDALLAGDVDRALTRAARGGLSLGEVAGRSLLLGARAPLVAILPLLRTSAERDAAIVALCLGDAPVRVSAPIGAGEPVATALVLALAETLESRLEPSDAARAIAALPTPSGIDERDRLLVDAAARTRSPVRAVTAALPKARVR